MASFVTNEGSSQLLSGGSVTWASDTIKARLVASSFTPNKDDDVMTGYTAIGTDQTLGSKTKTKDDSTDRVVFDAADPTWSAVAGGSTVGWVVIYKFVTNDGDSIPLAVLDVTDTATNGGDLVGVFDSGGIFYTQE